MKHAGPVLIAVALKLNKMLDLSKKPARKQQQSSCVCVAGGSRALRSRDPGGTGWALPVGAVYSREFGRLAGLRLPSSQHQGGFSWYVSPSCGSAAPGLCVSLSFLCCEFRG